LETDRQSPIEAYKYKLIVDCVRERNLCFIDRASVENCILHGHIRSRSG